MYFILFLSLSFSLHSIYIYCHTFLVYCGSVCDMCFWGFIFAFIVCLLMPFFLVCFLFQFIVSWIVVSHAHRINIFQKCLSMRSKQLSHHYYTFSFCQNIDIWCCCRNEMYVWICIYFVCGWIVNEIWYDTLSKYSYICHKMQTLY